MEVNLGRGGLSLELNFDIPNGYVPDGKCAWKTGLQRW